MGLGSITQYILFLAAILLLVKPVGSYMAAVFQGERTFLDPVLRPLERGLYRVLGVPPDGEMTWSEYACAFLAFSLAGTLLLFLQLRLQAFLPWSHPKFETTPLTPDLAMNTAVSFATTTTWQAYAGEATMSYLSQLGLAAQNFLAGAAGLAVGVAFIRGFSRQRTDRLGSFWVDLIRSLLWVLLPFAAVGSLVLVWQGVPLNFAPYVHATTVEGGAQVIAQGPVAALEFIKNLGTNGGGFFNVNGAHPYENPTPLTNFVEMLGISVVPAAFVYTFGSMLRRPRVAWTLLTVMASLFAVAILLCDRAENAGIPQVSRVMTATLNLEGKETRFGVGGSVLTAVNTSNTATGSYNSMHDSYTPIGGLVPLVNMLLGEIVFGGLGAGLYSMLMMALVGVFLAGLMTGRTPEYVGKSIGAPETKMLMLYALAGPFAILLATAVAVVHPLGLAGLTTNGGPHGFSEIVYAYASAMANNGQNFAGLSANSPFYNLTTGVVMLIGRFALAIPALALAGLLAAQGRKPITPGSMPADTFTFGMMVAGTALLFGAICYFPVVALGPVVEHLKMLGGS